MGRVAVVGSLNLDMVVRAARLPDPGETLHGESYQTFPGGKGLNQAAAACRAGAAVALVGRLGADDAGRMLRGVLEHEGIDTRHVLDDARVGTGIAVIQLDAAG